jgi:hypothetical protein
MEYDTIAPNVSHVAVQGNIVQVKWKCAATGREVGESSYGMVADASMKSRIQASVQRSIASELIYGLARAIAGSLGGAAGRVVSNATYTAANDLNTRATAGADYTEASRRAAIAAAFDAVQSSFVWDDARKKFIAK